MVCPNLYPIKMKSKLKEYSHINTLQSLYKTPPEIRRFQNSPFLSYNRSFTSELAVQMWQDLWRFCEFDRHNKSEQCISINSQQNRAARLTVSCPAPSTLIGTQLINQFNGTGSSCIEACPSPTVLFNRTSRGQWGLIAAGLPRPMISQAFSARADSMPVRERNPPVNIRTVDGNLARISWAKSRKNASRVEDFGAADFACIICRC
jgi:hypothetical protein